MTAKSIIIFLNTKLQLISCDFVNEKELNFEIIDELEAETKFLNLADRFEDFWKMHDDLGNLKSNKFFFFLGSKAGFTDSRIVSIWLKSLHFFKPEIKIYSKKIEENSEFIKNDLLVKNKIIKLLEESSKKEFEFLYSAEPTIG